MTLRMNYWAALLSVLTASPATAGEGLKPTGFETEAQTLVDGVWQSTLRECGTSAFEVLDNRVVIELDRPQFHLAPTLLVEPAKAAGYEHQVTAIASARRWRWANLENGKVADWQQWQEGRDMLVRHDQFGGNRGHTLVTDAVLQFDLVRKDGEWKANFPLSPLNSKIRPFDLSGKSAIELMTCEALLAGV